MRTVEQLRAAQVRVAVVDHEPEQHRVELVESWGRAHIAAARQPRGELRAAGIAGARAIVCALASDLRNVQTALLVRDLREDIAVVADLDNPTVGRLEEATGEGSRSRCRPLRAGGGRCLHRPHDPRRGARSERFVPAEVDLAAGDPAELFGDLVPVGVDPRRTESSSSALGGARVAVGDRVTVLGKPEDLGRPDSGRRSRRRRAGVGRVRQLRRVRRSLAQRNDRAVGIT